MLTIIEDIPGSGKTEAGLFLAQALAHKYHKFGLYIGLPTSATAGAMCDRYNDMLHEFDIKQARLMYEDAWLRSSDSEILANDAEKWFRPLRLAMLQQNGVGTVDQAIMAVLPNKFAALRMLGLSSKVLIIDEIHAYDPFMQGELEALLSYCKGCRVPVILLSATLSNEKKSKLLRLYLSKKNMAELQLSQHYPLMTVVDPVSKNVEQIPVQPSSPKTYQLHTLSGKDEAADLLIQKAESEECCGFYIADTVGSAIEMYQYVQAHVPDNIQVLLFTANFSSARRSQIEETCLRAFGKDRKYRPKKMILIATQVIEQSLDIDGDFLVTEPCSMDLFIQRIGRIWRHSYQDKAVNGKLPEIYIITDKDLSKYVYRQNLTVISNTLDWIRSHKTLTVPDEIRSAIADVVPDASSDDVSMAAASIFAGESNTLPIPTHVAKGVVSSKLFTPGSLHTYFTYDEDSVYAVTRQGRRSVSICIIPPSLYDKVLSCSDIVPNSLIRKIYEYKVNRPYETWMNEYMHQDLSRISDLVLLRAENEFEPCETGIFRDQDRYLCLNRYLGLITQEDT